MKGATAARWRSRSVSVIFADQRDRVERALIGLVAPHHEPHHQTDEGAEQHDHDGHRHVEPDEHGVEAQHHEHREILVEILHGDRVTGGQQHVAAMLEQRVHRHDEEARQRAHDHQEHIGEQQIARNAQMADMQAPMRRKEVARVERHQHDGDAHQNADRQYRKRLLERDARGRDHRAGGHAHGYHGLQHRAFRERHAERDFGPFQHDELQCGARAPEQRRDRERNLAELVVPERVEAVGEIGDEADRTVLLARIARAGVGNAQIEEGGDHVDGHDHEHRGFGRRVDRGGRVADHVGGDVRADQRAAEHGAENDGADRGALDPAIGGDEPFRRQQFRQNAVFGRRIRRRAETDHAVREQGMRAGQHHGAAHDLDRVRDKHHFALRAGISKGADECGKNDVGKDEEQLEQRRHPVRGVKVFQQCNRSDQERIVGQRRKKLRGHDGVKAFFHLMRCCPRCGPSAPDGWEASGLITFEMGCAQGFISRK
ncbi:hypothetical protein PT2222_50309 [Paraburkholderia tropica]